MSKDKRFDRERREAMRKLGLGVAATVGAAIVSDRVFAKQFAGEIYPTKVPDMTYDPELQMMVDPVTRRPIHTEQRVATINTTITPASGRYDKPRCDDYCEQ